MSQTEPQSISHTEQVLNEIEAKLFSLPHDSRSNHVVLIDHYLKKWARWNTYHYSPPVIPTIFTPVSGEPNQVSLGSQP